MDIYDYTYMLICSFYVMIYDQYLVGHRALLASKQVCDKVRYVENARWQALHSQGWTSLD